MKHSQEEYWRPHFHAPPLRPHPDPPPTIQCSWYPHEGQCPYIIRAKQATVFDFFPFGFCKNCSGFRGQWKRTSARSILRLVLFHYRSDFHDRMPDSQCSAFFVNAVPLQTEQFTSAQSVNRCDFDKRQQRVILQRGKQCLHLRGTVKMRFLSLLLRQLHKLAWIRG